MVSRNAKSHSDCHSSRSGREEVAGKATSTHSVRTSAPDHKGRDIYSPGGLRDRLRTSPRCPACGASIDLPNKARLVRCGECGCKALPDVYREWGAITDRVIVAIYSLGAWSDAELTIRSGDREVARIDIPERSATVDPSETRLATLLARYDLAIREGEVAA